MNINAMLRKAFSDGYMEGNHIGTKNDAYQEQEAADRYMGKLANEHQPITWMYAAPANERYPYPHNQSWSLTRRHDLPGFIETALYSHE